MCRMEGNKNLGKEAYLIFLKLFSVNAILVIVTDLTSVETEVFSLYTASCDCVFCNVDMGPLETGVRPTKFT